MQQLELLKEDFYNELGIVFTDDQFNFLNTNRSNTLLFVRNIRNTKNIKFVKRKDIRLNYMMFSVILVFFTFPFFLNNMILIVKFFWFLTSVIFWFFALKYKKYEYKIIVITKSSELIYVEVDPIFKEEAEEIVSIVKSKIKSFEPKLIYKIN
ncbi:hypothetical protein [Flavobacterium luteum]|uniref:Uncharacterized protein n=1 Tax=Flavobacterium luteum TaxID=2026654 RepID=A0A7J5AH41_9FLAO|nr:hypothetical protein [Flavobacterium luteum]KAB1156813.1 hypothetical protein F6464_05535 [Flavobacterium luteum]